VRIQHRQNLQRYQSISQGKDTLKGREVKEKRKKEKRRRSRNRPFWAKIEGNQVMS
jgi:hypothetical protein